MRLSDQCYNYGCSRILAIRAHAAHRGFVFYCKGMLCSIVPMPALLVWARKTVLKSINNNVEGLVILSIVSIGVATLSCTLVRHQTMMHNSSPLRLKKVSFCIHMYTTERRMRIQFSKTMRMNQCIFQGIVKLIILSIMVTFSAPSIAFCVFPFSSDESERLINEVTRFHIINEGICVNCRVVSTWVGCEKEVHISLFLRLHLFTALLWQAWR